VCVRRGPGGVAEDCRCERRRIHAAIATDLDDGDADRRAWHRSQAVVGIDDTAAAEREAAADRAAARGAMAPILIYSLRSSVPSGAGLGWSRASIS